MHSSIRGRKIGEHEGKKSHEKDNHHGPAKRLKRAFGARRKNAGAREAFFCLPHRKHYLTASTENSGDVA